MSFGCIAFLRGFFDDDHFQDQIFIADPPRSSTKEKLLVDTPTRTNDDTNINNRENLKNSIKLKTIVRGKSKEADIFLDWLEVSTVDAIHKRYLKGICVSILLNKEKPSELYESYIFGISYDDNGNTNISFENDIITATRKSIQNLMKRFIVITQGLPNLPNKRYLSMRMLFLNDDCPLNYQPNFFKDCTSEIQPGFKVPKNELKDLSIVSCGYVNSEKHQFSAKIINYQSYPRKDVKEWEYVDPFDYLKLKKLPVLGAAAATAALQTSQCSQITNDFKNLLKEKEPHIELTQPILQSFCDCKSSIDLKYSVLAECTNCARKIHKICYGYTIRSKLPSIFICFSCKIVQDSVSKQTKAELPNDLLILMNIRKLYAFFHWYLRDGSNATSLPNSFETLSQLFGYTSPEFKLVSQVITVLIYDEILDITQSSCVNLKNEKLSTSFQFAMSELEVVKYPINYNKGRDSIKSNESYYLTFIPSSLRSNFYKIKDSSYYKIKRNCYFDKRIGFTRFEFNESYLNSMIGKSNADEDYIIDSLQSDLNDSALPDSMKLPALDTQDEFFDSSSSIPSTQLITMNKRQKLY
ncbi:hypothetical protein B5S33_g3965 [[Candida] boidinii]|nr:hypothetical protein B5S33_g3965 [[Candida] boidinii]